MSDDPKNAGRPERDGITLELDYQVRDWSKTLRTSEKELREAVEPVSSTALNERDLEASAARRRIGDLRSNPRCAQSRSTSEKTD